ncbi:hypothetical protein Tco_1027581, partial [Tanacetum coccineum]
MSAITDVKCVLTQKALDAFCNKFHILEEVHPVLPNQNDTMHKRPAGKIGWMSFSKRSDNAFHMTRDPAPVSAEFNAQHYATLVAHPSPFRKFPEAFLYLVGVSRHYTLDKETYPWFLHKNREEMDIFSFIHTPDPTKVRVVEREQNKDEPRLLDTTIGGTVSLLPVAPDRAESELEASVERPETSRKRKSVIVDVGGASHPPKKLRGDHGTPSGTSVGGKYRSTIKRLVAGAVLNAEVGVTTIPTLPFVTASVSSTPEREAEVDSLVRSSTPIMTTVTTVTSTVDPASVAKEKHVEPSMFCADSSSAGGTDPTTGVFSDLTGSDFLVGAIRTIINPDADLQKTYVPQWSVTNGFRLDDGRVCREMVDEFAPPKFFASVREWNMINCLLSLMLKTVVERQGELLKVREEEIKNLKAQLLLREAEASKDVRLRVEASNFEDVKKSLRDETNALKERNTILEKERNALDVKVTELEASAAGKERELTDLNALITSVKSQIDNLVDRVHELETS